MRLAISDISRIVLMSDDALGPRTNWLSIYRKDGTTLDFDGKDTIAEVVGSLETQDPRLADVLREALGRTYDMNTAITLYEG